MQFLAAVGGQADLIPYRGGAPAVNDLLAGAVDMLMEQAVSAIPNTQGGMARALLVTGPTRLAALPGVPTAAEAGLPRVDLEVWNGIVLPRDTPEEIRRAWGAALSGALDEPMVRGRLEQLAGRVPAGTEREPAHLARLIGADAERWGRLLGEKGIAAE